MPSVRYIAHTDVPRTLTPFKHRNKGTQVVPPQITCVPHRGHDEQKNIGGFYFFYFFTGLLGQKKEVQYVTG